MLVDTDWLHPADPATAVTLKGGEKLVQNGPFAETHETLGGFFTVDVADLDAALVWAEKCPAAQTGKVEMRVSAMSDG